MLTLSVKSQTVTGGKRKIRRLAKGINFEGKKYSISVARLVYYLFVKKFDLDDRRLVVSPIDGNGLNLTLGNLQLTTPSRNILKAYSKKHRPRESFGHKAKVLSQYTLKGDWVATYLSISQAAQKTGISSSSIFDVLAGHRTHGNGFLWRYGTSRTKLQGTKKVKKIIASKEFRATAVSQFDFNGTKIKEYDNIKAAAKSVKVNADQIRKVILGHRLSLKGYYWKLGSYPDKIDIGEYEDRRQKAKAKVVRQVSQYDLTGKKIASYCSIAEAARSTNRSLASLWDTLKRPLRSTASGFLWMYGDGPMKITPDITVKRKVHLKKLYQNPVTQYDRAGIRVRTYATLKAAAKAVDGQLPELVAVIEGKQSAFRGYFWRSGKGKSKIDVTADIAVTMKRVLKQSKLVVLFSRKGKKIKEYASLSAAARALETYSGEIRRAIMKKKRFPDGSFFEYK